MRVEANISVSNTAEFGTKTEIKNLNSFRAMERAVEYEIKRQIEMLKKGEKVVQQTLGWDENKQATFPQRAKEGSADYRYFPDPDIPSFRLSEMPELSAESLKATLPQLPWQRREGYIALGLKADDADLFTKEPQFGDYFDAVCADYKDVARIKLAANYIANDLVKIVRDIDRRESELHHELPISVQYFKSIIDMLAENKISSRAGKDLLAAVILERRDPETIAKERDLFQKSDAGQLDAVIGYIISNNPTVVADFKAGKVAALEFLVGQGMKALRGSANPQMLRELIQKAIG
jgi:aspartyl-tRNA(Asn)/glutamyl-tRNA(Gln) amidotransferase subunit B